MKKDTLQNKANLTVLRAKHLGMCFGVRDAITLAKRVVKSRPLTVLGELVHNATVLDDLRGEGVQFETLASDVKTEMLMITAHGASNRTKVRARESGLKLRDATCPLVHHAHKQVRQLVEAGYHPVVIGRRGHVEVRGLTEDLAECDVVLSEEDIDALAPRQKYGVVTQTTQPIARVYELVDYLQDRFPAAEVRFVDTVCQPTKQRQSAAVSWPSDPMSCWWSGVPTAITPTNSREPAGSIVTRCIMCRAGRCAVGMVAGIGDAWHHCRHIHSRCAHRFRGGSGAPIERWIAEALPEAQPAMA